MTVIDVELAMQRATPEHPQGARTNNGSRTAAVIAPNTATPRANGCRRSTRADEIRDAVEESIATGLFPQGMRLDEGMLARRFAVSRTPMREAIMQLSALGIVESRGSKGMFVPTISPLPLLEMLGVLADLEAMCGRLAARRSSKSDYQAIVLSHDACGTACMQDDIDDYDRANRMFHRTIYRCSGNVFLADQTWALRRRLRSYCKLQLGIGKRMSQSFAEHERIVDALLGGDGNGAAEYLRTHVTLCDDRFEDFLSSLPRTTSIRSPEAKHRHDVFDDVICP